MNTFIVSIFENDGILEYLEKRNLVKQFKKSKKYLIDGKFKNVDFKLREPKEDGIYYFRINKQYRALAKIVEGVLVVFKISNHQN